MLSNNYKYIRQKEHEHTNTKGYIYEHIIVAEKKLKRKLKPDEVVHHKDRNRKNNKPDNLMVFATSSDHAMYHRGCPAYKDGDVWVCRKKILKKTCEYCGSEYFVKDRKEYKERKYCSQECACKARSKILIDINSLQEEILNENGNFSKVAKKYSISANAIVNILKKNGYPFHSKDYKKIAG